MEELTMAKKLRRKKILSTIAIIIATILVWISIDPDSQIITDMPYGTEVLQLIAVLLVAFVGITFTETILPEMFSDNAVGEDKDLLRKALNNNMAAAIALVARAITQLGWSIIVATAIYGYFNYSSGPIAPHQSISTMPISVYENSEDLSEE